MEKHETKCSHCGGQIEEFFDKKYNGKRGKCTKCGVDFPLE